MRTLHSYSDPGHGWLKVPKMELVKLNIVHLISHHSYQRGEYAYLEEDCDIGIFLKAYFNGVIPDQWWNILKTKSHSSNKSSRIRNYERFNNKGE